MLSSSYLAKVLSDVNPLFHPALHPRFFSNFAHYKRRRLEMIGHRCIDVFEDFIRPLTRWTVKGTTKQGRTRT